MPDGHWHAPDWHVLPAPQTTPQAPQFELSLLVSTHALPHWVAPPAQTQLPLVHVLPAPQTTPQAPQFELSLLVSTHALPHDVVPLAHAQAPP